LEDIIDYNIMEGSFRLADRDSRFLINRIKRWHGTERFKQPRLYNVTGNKEGEQRKRNLLPWHPNQQA
jgi:hypothetical protein